MKSWFGKDKKTIKEKFVLTSAGGGTKLSAFCVCARIQKMHDLLKDTEFMRQLRVVVVYEQSPDGRRNSAGRRGKRRYGSKGT